MKNEFIFKVGIRSGKRTELGIWVSPYGSENQIRIGKETFSKQEVGNWIRAALLAGIKKAALRP